MLTQSQLDQANTDLDQAGPAEIAAWAVANLPGLFQSTALGLSGLVLLHILSDPAVAPAGPPPAIFIDTLHHFDDTLDLLDRVQARYPDLPVHVFRPAGAADAAAFAAAHGPALWRADPDRYDFVAKVEPAARAVRTLRARALLTGRRRSQGGARVGLPVVELVDGIVKVNPLANWSFGQVRAYVDQHRLPYNALLDRGYKSVGDWHSTVPVADGEDERAGRWKGEAKTECGIHATSRYARFLAERDRIPEPAAEPAKISSTC